MPHETVPVGYSDISYIALEQVQYHFQGFLEFL